LFFQKIYVILSKETPWPKGRGVEIPRDPVTVRVGLSTPRASFAATMNGRFFPRFGRKNGEGCVQSNAVSKKLNKEKQP
jgi:hypothetical protein